MKVAAYQAPLRAAGSMEVLKLIQERVAWCEAEGVSILCCPEAILGGLADYGENPLRFAIRTDGDHLSRVLAPLASDTVTSIVGFTEFADGRLFNAAAVLSRGRVVGLYRKLYPAIRRSVYSAGTLAPVFRVGELTFGILICNDSKLFRTGRNDGHAGRKSGLCAYEQRRAESTRLHGTGGAGESYRYCASDPEPCLGDPGGMLREKAMT